MEMLPQVAATELSGKPAAVTLPHHGCVGPEADQDTALEALQSITTENEAKEYSTEKGEEEDETESFGHSTQALEITLNSELEEALAGIHRKKGFAFNCDHFNFPLCECVARAANPRPNHGRLGRRSCRRSHRGPTLADLRDTGLEVFDETEESDFQESETETENLLADTTDAESDYTAGLESDVEGAVGGDDPNQLAPPSTTCQRRASIVTADSRRDDIAPSPEPIKVAVFGTDGVGKSVNNVPAHVHASLLKNTQSPYYKYTSEENEEPAGSCTQCFHFQRNFLILGKFLCHKDHVKEITKSKEILRKLAYFIKIYKFSSSRA
ncbi:uncharacterized protein LOC123499591 isoform X2 [Portunus trituberculatus]|uniref:uncharacterized protein LOC123499591 isoform X2 n=1 Tax=Portunus trituberculatus TaxID=210409 RepID=UPI001E1D0A5B|nr:uncharacterized protein LOC123499591 isoform X2 [Portunus trituberculatus]